MLRYVIGACLGLLVAAAGAGFAVARLTPAPDTLGLVDGRLALCPSSPNCVSSQAEPSDQVHFIAPVPLAGTAAEMIAQAQAALEATPRVTIVTVGENYLHALVRSPTFGFPDDLEVYADEAEGLLHLRSAARLGYSDNGMNRQHAENLSARLLNR